MGIYFTLRNEYLAHEKRYVVVHGEVLWLIMVYLPWLGTLGMFLHS